MVKNTKDLILICSILLLDKHSNMILLIIEEDFHLSISSMLWLIHLIHLFIQHTIQHVLSKIIWHMIWKIQPHLRNSQLKRIQENCNISEEKRSIFMVRWSWDYLKSVISSQMSKLTQLLIFIAQNKLIKHSLEKIQMTELN